jgi:metallophosphoesterase superfamily enzyme
MIPTKWLLIGDVHAKVEDLEDVGRLMSYIEEICLGNKVDRIVFLGDQHHHHGVMHVKVVKFWTDAIQRLSKLAEVVLMVGNHDLANTPLSWMAF